MCSPHDGGYGIYLLRVRNLLNDLFVFIPDYTASHLKNQ